MIMSTGKVVTAITVAILLLTGLFVFSFWKRQDNLQPSNFANFEIQQTWKMPSSLNEISGIAFLNDTEIACIQDEDGIIFIYDLEQEKIVEEIKFAGAGDYEGIAIANNTAYVVESNGNIYEIENFRQSNAVNIHKTFLTQQEDVEGLSFDQKNNQLLVAFKEKDPNFEKQKGIYAFDLLEKKLIEKPVVSINLSDSIFGKASAKGHAAFKPSEIAINPSNQEFVLIEGSTPKILILDKSGKAKEFFHLRKDDFPQPEGLAFGSNGSLYIASEGNPGIIQKIKLK